MMFKIQSISDLITNSSTEVFVVYSKSNIKDIKDLVNAIISLTDPSKTFDDYFTIEMLINYDELDRIFNVYCYDKNYYDDFPEFKTYSKIVDSKEVSNYLKSLDPDTIEEIFDFANSKTYYDEQYYIYEGFLVKSKIDDPLVNKVASTIAGISSIFDIDFLSNC